jgi:hypothetical protein
MFVRAPDRGARIGQPHNATVFAFVPLAVEHIAQLK